MSADRTSGTHPSPKPGPYDGLRLSFIAAFVDSAGYIGLFQLFSAHITGNFVVIGSQLVHRQGEVLIKILALPTFIVGVAMAYVIARMVGGRAIRLVPVALFAEALFLCGAAALAQSAPSGAGELDPFMAAAALLLVVAMGLQNGMQRIGLASLPPTTVMTSNVSYVAVDLLVLAFGKKGASHDASGLSISQSRERLKRLWPLLAGFGVGATAGAAGIAWVGYSCLYLAALLCVETALHYLRGRRSAGGPA